MARPSQTPLAILAGTATPYGLPPNEDVDVTVWIPATSGPVQVAWEVDEGGALVAPVEIYPLHQETWRRRGIGGAPLLYLYAVAAAQAVIVVEDP